MDQGSTRNQEFKPKVDDLSTYSAHLVAFATETLSSMKFNLETDMDIGAIDGLSFKVSHHAEHCQRGWPTSFSTGGRGGCLKVDLRFEGCGNLECLR